MFLGVGDVGKGPSNVSGHYQGITPPTSGYTIYVNTTGVLTAIFCANNDTELIRFTNGFSGQNFITATECLNWYATQTNYICSNRDYEGIVTSGLTVNVDAGFTPSYTSSGITLYDLSYNGYNSTLVNGTSYNSANGGVLVFDGVNDYVGFSSGYTQLSFTGSSPYTLEIFVKIDEVTEGSYERLVDKEGNEMGSGRDGYNILVTKIGITSGSTRIQGERWAAGLNYGGFSYTKLDNNFIGIWNHFVWSYSSGSNNSKFYNNGYLVDQRNAGGSLTNIYRLLRIMGASGPLKGSVSSFRIYNRPLSGSEVLQNYQAQFPRFLGQNIVMNGLVNFLDAGYNGSYPTSGTTWTNISGVSGGTGTLTNGPTYSSSNGGVIDFDGVDDYVIIPYDSYWDNNVFGNATNFTISCWTKCDNFFNWACLIQKAPIGNGFYSGSEGASLWVSSGGFQGAFGNGVSQNPSGYGSIVSFPTSNTNGWYHLLYAGDGTTGRLYVNGSLFSEANLGRTLPVTTSLNGPKLGVRSNQSHYNGKIANTLFYTRPLSAAEVLQNYQAQFPQILGENIITNGLVLYLDAGYGTSYPGTGTTWTNVSGVSGGTGTLTNGPTYDSANGGSIVFDGVNDFVLGNTNLGLSADPSFTISYFARWDGSSFSTNYPSGVGNNSTGVSNRGLSTTWQNGRIALDFWVNRFRANVPLNVQTWYHVAFTKSPGLIGTTSKLYVNGVEVSGSVEGTNTTPNITDSPLVVGRLDNTRWFNGKINNVSIYNRTLTANEILQNFNAQKSRFGL